MEGMTGRVKLIYKPKQEWKREHKYKPKHMKKLKHKLCEKTGAAEIFIVVLLMIGMIVLSVVYEYIRVQIYANNIKDSFKRAILTVASENYNEIYAGLREFEGTSGEYEGGPEGGGDTGELPRWVPLNDFGDVYSELEELLGLEEDSTGTSLTGEYELSEVAVYLSDADISASGNYEVKGSIKARIPVYFLGVVKQEVVLVLKVKAAYTAKY